MHSRSPELQEMFDAIVAARDDHERVLNLLADYPDDHDPDAVRIGAETLMAIGELDHAEQAFKELARLTPGDEAAGKGLALVALLKAADEKDAQALSGGPGVDYAVDVGKPVPGSGLTATSDRKSVRSAASVLADAPLGALKRAHAAPLKITEPAPEMPRVPKPRSEPAPWNAAPAQAEVATPGVAAQGAAPVAPAAPAAGAGHVPEYPFAEPPGTWQARFREWFGALPFPRRGEESPLAAGGREPLDPTWRAVGAEAALGFSALSRALIAAIALSLMGLRRFLRSEAAVVGPAMQRVSAEALLVRAYLAIGALMVVVGFVRVLLTGFTDVLGWGLTVCGVAAFAVASALARVRAVGWWAGAGFAVGGAISAVAGVAVAPVAGVSLFVAIPAAGVGVAAFSALAYAVWQARDRFGVSVP